MRDQRFLVIMITSNGWNRKSFLVIILHVFFQMIIRSLDWLDPNKRLSLSSTSHQMIVAEVLHPKSNSSWMMISLKNQEAVKWYITHHDDYDSIWYKLKRGGGVEEKGIKIIHDCIIFPKLIFNLHNVSSLLSSSSDAAVITQENNDDYERRWDELL